MDSVDDTSPNSHEKPAASAVPDGGPAFPVVVPGHLYGDGSSEIPYVDHRGMSLRDWFAAAAFQGSLSNPYLSPPLNVQELAVAAYNAADAMLRARGKQ